MQKWREWQTAPHSEWSVALEREAVIRPLAELNRLTMTAVQQAVAILCSPRNQHRSLESLLVPRRRLLTIIAELVRNAASTTEKRKRET